jgi:hypothetical protein
LESAAVIQESSDWKDPLLTSARRFRRFQKPANLSDLALTQIERDIFVSFYSIRKLIEKPGALTDATKASTWHCVAFPNVAPVTLLNRHRLHELYDLASRQQATKDLGFLCHQVVHSFAFALYFKENGGFGGVLCASDRARASTLYGISAEILIAIFRRVGTDYPRSVSMHHDLETRAVTATAT